MRGKTEDGSAKEEEEKKVSFWSEENEEEGDGRDMEEEDYIHQSREPT